jgi:hypothetical protein
VPRTRCWLNGSRRPTTNRRTLAKARKLVNKWRRAAERRLDQQLATGVLDLSPGPDEVQLELWHLAAPGATLRGKLNDLIGTAKEVIRKGGDQPCMLILETADGLLV